MVNDVDSQMDMPYAFDMTIVCVLVGATAIYVGYESGFFGFLAEMRGAKKWERK